jgi:hypothetical protein
MQLDLDAASPQGGTAALSKRNPRMMVGDLDQRKTGLPRPKRGCQNLIVERYSGEGQPQGFAYLARRSTGDRLGLF